MSTVAVPACASGAEHPAPDRQERRHRTSGQPRESPRVKQYLKNGWALRIEMVINDPRDLLCKRRRQHLDELQAKGRAINAHLLDTERVGQRWC